MPDWKNFEGHLLDGKYPLERYLGGDDDSAVFMIGFANTAVTLRRADGAKAESLVEQWNRVKALRHPHLLELDATGIASLGDERVAYVVGEHAEQNLAEILADRPLTADETREMLEQVASALAHLHSRGLMHGHLKASNILALGESVKLSSDTATEGDPATDVRALGFTLIHALTQKEETTPVNLPAPFAEIARGCLHPDPARRWSADQVVERLRSPQANPAPAPVPPAAVERTSSRKWIVPVGLVAAGLAIAAVVAIRRPETPAPAPSQVARVTPPPSAPVIPEPAPAPSVPQAKASAPTPRVEPKQATRDRLAIEDGVAERIVPQAPVRARNTIDGKPVVVVRVTVSQSGSVTDAEVEKTFSPYFSKLATEAARKWRFVPEESPAPRQWLLRFQFTRTDTQVVARKAR